MTLALSDTTIRRYEAGSRPVDEHPELEFNATTTLRSTPRPKSVSRGRALICSPHQGRRRAVTRGRVPVRPVRRHHPLVR